MNPARIAAAGVNWIRSRFGAKARLVRRVQARKLTRASGPDRYNDNPRVSVVAVPPFRHEDARRIVARLRSTGAEELIACVDGSPSANEAEWLRQLIRPNDFVIRSDGVNGTTGADMAIRLARGEIVCVLSQVETLPPSGEWLRNALELFDRYPRLTLLGTVAGENLRDLQILDPGTRIPFMPESGASGGAVFFRQQAFVELGGFRPVSLEASDGDPVHSFCLRAWLSGWSVGLTGLPAPARSQA